MDEETLQGIDEALTRWESSDLLHRAEMLEQHQAHADDSHEVDALVTEIDALEAAIRAASEHIVDRLSSLDDEIESLDTFLTGLSAPLDSAQSEVTTSLRALGAAVQEVHDEFDGSTEGLLEGLETTTPESANTTREGLSEQVSAFGERVQQEWLPQLQEALHSLNERLATIEEQVGTECEETEREVRHEAEEADRRVRTSTHERMSHLREGSQSSRRAVEAVGQAAETTGTVMLDGQHAVGTISSATQSGVVVAVEVLDELLRLMQNVRDDD